MSRIMLEEGLFESTLNEAFSPSMPMWLQDRLMFLKTNGYGSKNAQKRASLTAKGRNVQNNRNGGTQSTDYYSNRGDSTPLYKQMIRAGINLDKANFISGDVPTSGRDERVKSPNIPIFHLVIPENEHVYIGNNVAYGPVDSVYIKGLNDDEKLGNSDVLFKYLSFKQLIELTKDFCYLDGNDADTFSKGVRDARANTKAELKKIPNYDRLKKSPSWGIKLDKSGYIIDPEKYKRKLAEAGRQDVQKTMNKIYSRLMRLKNEFASILLNHDINDTSDSDYEDIFGYNGNDLMRQLGRVNRDYNDVCNSIDRVMAIEDEQRRNAELDYIFGAGEWSGSGQIKPLTDRIESLEKTAARVIRAEVDWDTEDYID